MNFVAIDFETTGLNPHRDRIIEVAAIVFDSRGQVIEEFDSLVNPGTGIRASDVHGILDIDLVEAPFFPELIPHLVKLVNGNVIVAHNAPFDLKFLERELDLASVRPTEISGFCTLNALAKAFPEAPRRLAESCGYFGLPVLDSHQAADDARMTAALASHLLKSVENLKLPPSCILGVEIDIPKEGVKLLPRHVISNRKIEDTFLSQLVQRLPPTAISGDIRTDAVDRYLDLLNRVLEDRVVTDEEAHLLFELADDEGLSQSVLSTVHMAYFASLLETAKADHYLSVAERADLRNVAQLLGIENWQKYVDEATEIEVWKGGIPDRTLNNSDLSNSEFLRLEAGVNFDDPEISQMLSGRSIVITGEFAQFSRDQGQQAVVRRGGKATSSISSRTFALVAGAGAGPSKLEKAASLGVPILTYDGFRYLLETGRLGS